MSAPRTLGLTSADGLELLALLAVIAGLWAAQMMLGHVLRIPVDSWLAWMLAGLGVLAYRLRSRPGRHRGGRS